jgi:hypothetical protein
MWWRLKELFDGGGELIRAEAELAMNRLKRGLLAAVLLLAALAVAVLGLGVLLAGVTTALAAQMGWITALCLVGAVLLLLSLLAAWPALQTLRNPFSHDELSTHPVIRAAESRNQMADAVNPHVSKEQVQGLPEPERTGENFPPDFEGMKNAAMDFVSKHPAAVAGGAFLALSLIGPFRTVRMISRGLAVAGLATTVIEAMRDDKASGGNATPGRSRHPDPSASTYPSGAVHHRPITEVKTQPAAGRFIPD